MKRGDVSIPLDGPSAAAAEVGRLRSEALKMLAELESSATGTRPAKPGAWRHDPAGWLARTSGGPGQANAAAASGYTHHP